jgi:hypothetical protein
MVYSKNSQSLRVKPHYLLYLLAVSLPFAGFPFFNLENRAITWDWIIMLSLIALFWMKVAVSKHPKIPINNLLFWLLVFNIFLIISSIGPLFSGEKNRIVNFATTWPQYVLFSLGLWAVSILRVRPLFVRSLLRLYLMVAAAVALFGLIQVMAAWMFDIDLYLELSHVKYYKSESGYASYLGGLTRASSIFEEPRQFGVFLVIPFFIALRSLWEKPASLKIKLTRWLLCLLFIAGILLSFSISAYIGLVFGILLVSLILYNRWWDAFKTYIWFFLGVIVFLVITQSVSDFSAWEYLTRRFYAFTYGKEVWQFHYEIGGVARYIRGAIFGLKVLAEHPICGIGLNQFRALSLNGYEWVIILPPFALLASVGVFGSMSLISFFFLFIRKACKLRKYSGRYYQFEMDSSLLLVSVSLLLSFVGSGYNYQSSLFWFPIYVAALIIFNVNYWYRDMAQVGNLNLFNKEAKLSPSHV